MMYNQLHMIAILIILMTSARIKLPQIMIRLKLMNNSMHSTNWVRIRHIHTLITTDYILMTLITIVITPVSSYQTSQI